MLFNFASKALLVPGAQKGAGGSHARSILKARRWAGTPRGGSISGVAGITQSRALERAVSSSHRSEAGRRVKRKICGRRPDDCSYLQRRPPANCHISIEALTGFASIEFSFFYRVTDSAIVS